MTDSYSLRAYGFTKICGVGIKRDTLDIPIQRV